MKTSTLGRIALGTAVAALVAGTALAAGTGNHGGQHGRGGHVGVGGGVGRVLKSKLTMGMWNLSKQMILAG